MVSFSSGRKLGIASAFFAGADLPFVVRPHEDSESFDAIGPCYIYGMSEREI